ncbi:unnamed protein product [Cochlearia groenlandica]
MDGGQLKQSMGGLLDDSQKHLEVTRTCKCFGFNEESRDDVVFFLASLKPSGKEYQARHLVRLALIAWSSYVAAVKMLKKLLAAPPSSSMIIAWTSRANSLAFDRVIAPFGSSVRDGRAPVWSVSKWSMSKWSMPMSMPLWSMPMWSMSKWSMPMSMPLWSMPMCVSGFGSMIISLGL